MLRNKDFNLVFGVLDKKKLNLTTQPLRASIVQRYTRILYYNIFFKKTQIRTNTGRITMPEQYVLCGCFLWRGCKIKWETFQNQRDNNNQW